MRIVFLGSPKEVLSVPKFLLEQAGDIDCELVGVVSQPAKAQGRKQQTKDTAVAAFAKEQGIKLFLPESAKAGSFLEEFKALSPDIALTAAYGQILSDECLAIPKRATINIHPSLLPRYRGATPVPAALLDGLTETGVTILFTIKKLDAGNIIAQRTLGIGAEETSQELTERAFAEGAALLVETLAKLRDKNYYRNLSHYLAGAAKLEFDSRQELTTVKNGYFWED